MNFSILNDKLNNMDEAKKFLWVSAITFIIISLGCYKSISSVYMPDDFLLASKEMPLSFYLSQGRFIQALITAWFNKTSINIVSSSAIFTPFFFLSSALASSTFVFIILSKDNSFILKCLLSCLIVSHPVYSMMAVYHLATVCFALCMISVCIFMLLYKDYLESHRKYAAIASTFFVVLICGNYQPAFVVIFIFSYLALYFKHQKIITKAIFKDLLPIIVGLFAYALIFKLTKNILGENNWDTRAGLVENIPQRLNDIIKFIPNLFYKNWWIIPRQFSVALSINIFIFLTIYFIKNKLINISQVFYTVIFLMAPLLPLSLLKVWEPLPRALFSISFFYTATLIVFYNEKFLKLKVTTLSIAILIGLISSNHFLFKSEMEQKSDKYKVLNAYSLIKNSDYTNKDIVVVNENSLSVAFWAINGLFYFHTNENLNIKPSNEDDTEQCLKGEKKLKVITTNSKIIACLF